MAFRRSGLVNGVAALKKEPQNSPSSFPPRWTQGGDNHLQTKKKALTRYEICWCLGLGLPSLQTVGNKLLLLKPPSLPSWAKVNSHSSFFLEDCRWDSSFPEFTATLSIVVFRKQREITLYQPVLHFNSILWITSGLTETTLLTCHHFYLLWVWAFLFPFLFFFCSVLFCFVVCFCFCFCFIFTLASFHRTSVDTFRVSHITVTDNLERAVGI